MPLNEECGLLEWVTNTHGFKGILETNYGRQNKKIFVSNGSSNAIPLYCTKSA